jgi:8-oxo-dGTP diphosphatase
MPTWVQMALFDASAFVQRRFRPSHADNAAKRPGGRLLVAGGLVIDESGRVLLLHRATANLTWWETPGGKIDPGEGPRETAIRELEEELGVHSMIVEDLGWHDFESGRIPMRYALYQMKIVHGDPQPMEPAFDDAQFFTWVQIMNMRDQLSPNARTVVDKHAKGRLALA